MAGHWITIDGHHVLIEDDKKGPGHPHNATNKEPGHTTDSNKRGHDTYGWMTKKTDKGYDWKVTGFTYGKGTETLKAGTAATRAQAMGAAKRNVMPYRRASGKGKASTFNP